MSKRQFGMHPYWEVYNTVYKLDSQGCHGYNNFLRSLPTGAYSLVLMIGNEVVEAKQVVVQH